MLDFQIINDSNDYFNERFTLISGFEESAYVDTTGNPTIGYGFNLKDQSIFETQLELSAREKCLKHNN